MQGKMASVGKWGRFINANVSTAAFTINQRGSGDILSMESGGVEVAKFDNSGNLVFTGSITVDFGDDAGLAMGAGDDADLRYSTQDANAKMMQWGLPHVAEDGSNVAVLALMDRDLVGTDLSGVVDLSGTTEPTLAIINEAGNAGIIIGGAVIKSNTGSLTIDGDDGLILQTSGTKSVEVKEDLILGTGEAAIGAKTGNVFRGPDHPGGTDTDEDGADITISPGLGTGDGDAGTIIFQLPEVVGTGTTVQTRATVLTMDMAASTTLMSFDFQVDTAIDSTGTLQIRPTTGIVFIGDSNVTNTEMTTGITIDQGTAITEIITLKNSNVAHGMTALTETDTFGVLIQSSGNAGGIALEGYLDSGTNAVILLGIGVTDDTTKSTAGVAYLEIQAAKKNGSTRTSAGAGANLFSIRNVTSTEFIVGTGGDVWMNGEMTTGGGTPISGVALLVVDDAEVAFGAVGDARIRYETADTDARVLMFTIDESDDSGNNVPVFVFSEETNALGDLGLFDAFVEGSVAVLNNAGDAYASLDAGDNAIASAKGLAFRAAGDEDIEVINLTNTTGTPRLFWNEPLDAWSFSNRVSIGTFLNYGAVASATITTGVVAVTQTRMEIVVQGGTGAGNDQLDTATGGKNGDVLILQPATSGGADTVTVADGTGADAFILAGGANFVMDSVDDRLALLHNGTEWVETSRSTNS